MRRVLTDSPQRAAPPSPLNSCHVTHPIGNAAAVKRIVLALALAASAVQLRAADKDGAYGSQRPDNCREVLRIHPAGERRPETAGMRSWIAGYITAFNRQTPETYDITGITEFEQVLHAIEQFCKANPLADVGAAMEAVTDQLQPTRYQTKRQAGR